MKAVITAAALAILIATVVGALTASASATPPGSNGRIAFTRYAAFKNAGPGNEPLRGAIFTIGVDGKDERQVTRPPAGASDFQPDWSPDGSRIVFERQFEDKPFEIWSVNPDGSDPRQVSPGCGVASSQICDVSSPAWSPDGTRIAYGDAHGTLKYVDGVEWIEVGAVSVMDADGSNRHQLTQLRRPTSSEDFEPVWSPDGKRIAFQRENSTASPRNRRAIFVMNADGTGVRRLTPWNLRAGDHPDWSPDGRRILFRSPTSGLAGSSLYTIRPDGAGLQRLLRPNRDVEVLSASYSPDGKWIVFGRTGKSGLPDLWVMRPDGTTLRQLTRTAKWDSAPDWGPAK